MDKEEFKVRKPKSSFVLCFFFLSKVLIPVFH